MTPQSEAKKPASGRQIQNDRPASVDKQRIGIGADRIEGDIAEIEQAGEADDDVEPPAEHHIDEDLDAVIVDPFERSGGAEERQGGQRKGEEEDQSGGAEAACGERRRAASGGSRSAGTACGLAIWRSQAKAAPIIATPDRQTQHGAGEVGTAAQREGEAPEHRP